MLYTRTDSQLQSASARYVAFFQVLKRSLHAAPRNEVQAQLRPLFKVFLDALERRQHVEEVEDDEVGYTVWFLRCLF
jgi:hypothetical protein